MWRFELNLPDLARKMQECVYGVVHGVGFGTSYLRALSNT
jgi:hypothetical protein